MAFDIEHYLDKHRILLEQSPIKVKLVSATENPFDLAVASARTCYSSKGILLPQDMRKTGRSTEISERIARSTLKAGHLTTRQHANYVFAIEGISRNVIWQFLHSHPYYNSEQVSQRYVEISDTRQWYTLPPAIDNKNTKNLHTLAYETYNRLNEVLEPRVAEIYFSIHKAKARNQDKYAGAVKKKAMEVARYVMPLSTSAYLYHTISSLTLYRYIKTMYDTGHEEVVALVLKMAHAVAQHDPHLLKEFPEPETEVFHPAQVDAIRKSNAQFDANLSGLRSKMIGNIDHWPQLAANIWQQLTAEAIEPEHIFVQLFKKKLEQTLADTLYPVTMIPEASILSQLTLTFQKKHSHSTDSQEQRHRTLPGSRPRLVNQMSTDNDYIIPELIEQTPEARKIYEGYMQKNFELIREMTSKGYDRNQLTFLLPNAFPVRFYETGSLDNFFHKFKSRLCYNAQEEIFYGSLDEVKQLEDKMPLLKGLMGPPCHLRENMRPRCPEGDHFCGVKVWQLPLNQFNRVL